MSEQTAILRQSLVNTVINGAINAGISWFKFSKETVVPITLDHISNSEVTVFGQGVMVALTLSIIGTLINFKSFAKKIEFDRPFWPWGVRLAVRNAMTAFGAAMVVAVIWQRAVGSVMVSPVAATLVMFVIAGSLVFYVSMTTMQTMAAESHKRD